MDDQAAADVTGEAEEVAETAPPIHDENGVAQTGEYPANHRLRAEALAKAGLESDPGGMISDELIADTAKRVADEEAFEEAERQRIAKERPPVRANMSTAELEKIARKETIDLTSAANNADRVRLIEAARAPIPPLAPPATPPTQSAGSTETKEA